MEDITDAQRAEVEVASAELFVVCDIHTRRAACSPLTEGLVPGAYVQCYDPPPQASLAVAQALAEAVRSSGARAMLAIGSGTINDLCKYASHATEIPYAIAATAPSMNGYNSSTASLKDESGYKRSYPAVQPNAVMADPAILAAAPARLIASGVGDTLCRATVQMDATLASMLGVGENYHASFQRLYEREAALIDAIERGTLATPDGAQILMDALLEAGSAMHDAGSSAPASQGEHMIAHVLEVLDPTLSERHFHGEIIAVTTLHMARLQYNVLKGLHMAASASGGTLPLTLPQFPEADITHAVGETLAAQWRQAYAGKCAALEGATLTPTHLETLQSLLPDIAALEGWLKRAGCPASYTELGITDALWQQALTLAPFSRERFGFADIANFLHHQPT